MTRDEAIALRRIIEEAIKSLDDTLANEGVALFPQWRVGKAYGAGDRVRHGALLYRCLTAHTSQDDWAPGDAVSLWVTVADPVDEWPEWSQPAGAHDAYNTGDQVSHNDKHWKSDIDVNVWEPGVYGWTEAQEV